MTRAGWSLAGRRVLVTGATRGIGLATAEIALDFGAEVLVVGRDRARAEEVEKCWRDAGRAGLAIAADVTRAEGRAAIVEAVARGGPKLHALINNVGEGNRKPFLECSDAEIEALGALNFGSAAMLTRDLHPFLKRAEGASIVNVASVAGLISVPNTAVYAAQKGALAQLTRSLAVEWAGDRIRVNSVSPWFTRTPRLEGLLAKPEIVELIASRTPLGRVAEPEEIGAAIVFLCLPASSFITGRDLVADGGATIAGIVPRSS